jgi:predicted nucleotide-binding protein (sugar kinase/HSP70/actin superfamily)
MKIAHELIHDREEPDIEDVIREGMKYVPWNFQVETILTLGRTVLFIKESGVDAVVNASPMFCMPGTVSAAVFPRLEKEYGVPIISTFYDGSGDPNKSLAPYLHYLTERKGNGCTPPAP